LIQGAIPFTMFFSWLVSNPLVARILREKLNVRYAQPLQRARTVSVCCAQSSVS
jgi:hypothetical protein